MIFRFSELILDLPRLVGLSENQTLKYVHQDHLTSTALMTDTSGNSLGTAKYYPYGATRAGSVPTDKLFTGQRLDGRNYGS